VNSGSIVDLTFLAGERHDGIDGPSSHVPVSEVGPLGVVVKQPGVEISLQGLDGVVEVLPQVDPEELVEDGAVEALDEAVGPGRADFGAAVFDAVELEVEFIGVVLGAAELAAIAPLEGGWMIAQDGARSPCEAQRAALVVRVGAVGL
jgi:hypothetical protein